MRSLRRSRRFAIVAIATLASGIAANAIVFVLVSAVAIDPESRWRPPGGRQS